MSGWTGGRIMPEGGVGKFSGKERKREKARGVELNLEIHTPKLSYYGLYYSFLAFHIGRVVFTPRIEG